MQPEDILLVTPRTFPVSQMDLTNPPSAWRDAGGYIVSLSTGHVLTILPENSRGMADVEAYLLERSTSLQPTGEEVEAEKALYADEDIDPLKLSALVLDKVRARRLANRAGYEAECRIKLSRAQYNLRKLHEEPEEALGDDGNA